MHNGGVGVGSELGGWPVSVIGATGCRVRERAVEFGNGEGELG